MAGQLAFGVPHIVVQARMDLDIARPHPDEGYDEYPWVGDIVVQWTETTPDGDAVLCHRTVWTSEPRWDAPGYGSDEAENAARRDAALRLADALTELCAGGRARDGEPTSAGAGPTGLRSAAGGA